MQRACAVGMHCGDGRSHVMRGGPRDPGDCSLCGRSDAAPQPADVASALWPLLLRIEPPSSGSSEMALHRARVRGLGLGF